MKWSALSVKGSWVCFFVLHVASLARTITSSQMSILPFLWIWLVHKTPEGLEIPADFREPVVTSLSGASWQRSDITLDRWQVNGLLGISVFPPSGAVFVFLHSSFCFKDRRLRSALIVSILYLVGDNASTPNQLRGFIDNCISCNIASGLHQNLILQIMLRKWDFGWLKINKAVYG